MAGGRLCQGDEQLAKHTNENQAAGRHRTNLARTLAGAIRVANADALREPDCDMFSDLAVTEVAVRPHFDAKFAPAVLQIVKGLLRRLIELTSFPSAHHTPLRR